VSRNFFSIETEKVINAPIDAVWSVIKATGNYMTWNSFMTAIEGDFQVNHKVKISMRLSDKRTISFTATCLKVDPPHEMRWEATLIAASLFKGEHYIRLVKINDDQTRLIHAEDYSGLLAYPLKWLGQTMLRESFERMNEDLTRQF